MSDLVRLSFSIEKPLYDKFSKLVSESRYSNRSEYIRDMIRDRVVEREWEKNEEAVGTVTLVFNHAQRKVSEKLTKLQHDHHTSVLAATHIHLDHHMCAEMILIKGKPKKIRQIADLLGQQKGVLHSTLSISTMGSQL